MVEITPPGTPLSPAGSVYDLSDDDEAEYSTVQHVKPARGVKLLYSKSKVYVHPTPSAKDNIPGFIALIQQRIPSNETSSDSNAQSQGAIPSSASPVAPESLLLAWVPESSLGDAYETYVQVDLLDPKSLPKQSYLVPPPPTTVHGTSIGAYAFAVAVSNVYSLLIRPPSLGWWHGSVIINTRAGESFPALFFHDGECQSTILQRKSLAKEKFDPFGEAGRMFWGGDEVLRWLKQYASVERIGPDPNVYLINPTDDDRKGLGIERQKQRTQSIGSAQHARGKSRQGKDASMDPVTKALKDARWNILEKLSQVTTFTRRTAQAVADNPRTPPQLRRLINNPDVQSIQQEFDSARVYLARWAMGIAEQSERDKSQRIWTARDVLETEEGSLGSFEVLEADTQKIAQRPVTIEEWQSFFNETDGTLQITPDEVKDRIFHGGLDSDELRREAWLFLLGVYDWRSSHKERTIEMNRLREEYIRLKTAWWNRSVTEAAAQSQNEHSEWWREQRLRIEKDVHRTDRQVELFAGEDIPHPDADSPFADVGTNVHLEQMKDMLLTYNEFNKSLGYVQGMSDLLAPIYAVLQDDAIAFWAFVRFMDRMERNFVRDQSGMRLQLLTLDHLVQLLDPKLYLHLQSVDSTNFFFFFRMLLVWYKREFPWEDVLRLWEVLWTDYLSSNFHLFIAMAILEKHREVIMDHLKGFDEVLKYINELSGRIDLPSTLIRAEALFYRFQRMIEAIDRRSSFPIPKGSASALSTQSGAVESVAQSTATSEVPNVSSQPTSDNQAPETTERVISPELRHLLSRKIDRFDNGKLLHTEEA